MELVLLNTNDTQLQQIINNIPNPDLYESIYIQNCNFVIGLNFFRNLEHVKAITIKNVSSKMFPILGLLLQDFYTLRSVSIEFCSCNFWDIITFLQIIKKSNILVLELNSLFPQLKEEEIEILFQILYEYENIRILNWTGNIINTTVLVELAHFKYLECLTLSTDYFYLTAPVNTVLSHLKYVSIINILNNINEHNLSYFLDSIPHSLLMFQIKSLYSLPINSIFNFLSSKKQIRSLSLSGIGIDNNLFLHLCKIISSFQQLEKIDLSYNGITEYSYNSFLTLLQKLPQIKEIDISENRIQDHESFFDYLFTQNHCIKNVRLYSTLKHETIPKYNNYKKKVESFKSIWKEIQHFSKWQEMKPIQDMISHLEYLNVNVDVFDEYLIKIKNEYNRFLFLIKKYIHNHENYYKFNDWIEIYCKKNLVLHEVDIQREIAQYL